MGTGIDMLIKWLLGAAISQEDFVKKSVGSNRIALRIGTAFGAFLDFAIYAECCFSAI